MDGGKWMWIAGKWVWLRWFDEERWVRTGQVGVGEVGASGGSQVNVEGARWMWMRMMGVIAEGGCF